jgi:hypothetical protein
MHLFISRNGHNDNSAMNRLIFPIAFSPERIFPAQGCSCPLRVLVATILMRSYAA